MSSRVSRINGKACTPAKLTGINNNELEHTTVNGQTGTVLNYLQFNFKTTPTTDKKGHTIPDACKRAAFNMIQPVHIDKKNVRYCVIVEDEGEFVYQ